MKAYFTDIVNGESRLVAAYIDIPKPADDEILIKVRATALNRGGFIVGGVMHGASAYPSGTEAAGEIIQIGSKIESSISEYFYRNNLDDPTKNFNWEYILIDNKKVKLFAINEI